MLKESLTFTSFSTNDIDSTKEFYGSKLGLEIQFNFNGVVGYQTGGDTSFTVYFRENHTPAEYTVLNFKVKDIENEVNRLTKSGITFEQYPELHTNKNGITNQGEGKVAWFKDPAGNILSLME